MVSALTRRAPLASAPPRREAPAPFAGRSAPLPGGLRRSRASPPVRAGRARHRDVERAGSGGRLPIVSAAPAIAELDRPIPHRRGGPR